MKNLKKGDKVRLTDDACVSLGLPDTEYTVEYILENFYEYPIVLSAPEIGDIVEFVNLYQLIYEMD